MKIQNGDLIKLGEHLLLCGDAMKAEDVVKVLSEKSIDLVLTDPPYGIGYVEGKMGFTQSLGKSKVIKNDHVQSEAEYLDFTKSWIRHLAPHMAQKNAMYIFNTDKMIFPIRLAMQEHGFKFAQLLIWAKTHAIIARMDYLPQHELIIYGWHGTHQFLKAKDKSVIVYPKPSKSKLHPTMKPVGLLRRLILNSSKVNDIVYDPFGGSGSTLLACEQTKRRCLMIETDFEYCETIVMLWEKMTKQEAQRVDASMYVGGKENVSLG